MAWDKLPATSAERLQKLQNRAARVITKQGIRRSLDWDSLVSLTGTLLEIRYSQELAKRGLSFSSS